VQISWKKTLGLVMALSAVACGESEPSGDPFQGYIDTSALDTRFQPVRCSNATCNQTAAVNGDTVALINLGLVANPDTTKVKPPPAVLAESLAGSVYDFPDGCISSGSYDPRVSAFEETRQYPVFTRLPVTNAASATLPLVKVVPWKGSNKYFCNAVKDATTMDKGEFVLQKQANSTVALRLVVTTAEIKPANGLPYTPPLGWYKGLLLNYLEAGQVPVDADGNLKPMDGVIVNPTTGTASSVTANNVLVLSARPGEVGWSPMVRLREFTATTGTTPASYRSLCYDAPCAATAVDMSKATRYAGTLYLTTGAP
jgi:hypothetical protein